MNRSLRDRLLSDTPPDIPPQDEEAGGSGEQLSDRAGTNARFGVAGVQLELDGGKRVVGVQYGMIDSTIELMPGGILFHYVNGLGRYEVKIIGARLRVVADYLTWGMRMSVKETGTVDDPKKPFVEAILVTKIELEEGE